MYNVYVLDRAPPGSHFLPEEFLTCHGGQPATDFTDVTDGCWRRLCRRSRRSASLSFASHLDRRAIPGRRTIGHATYVRIAGCLTPNDIHIRRDKMNRRSILSVSATIALGLALFGITAGSTARAAEIKLLCAVALHPAIVALIPDFEKSSGHKVTIAYGTAGAVADRVQKGEAADIVISSVPLIDQLQAQGKVVAGSRVNIAKVGVGVFVRKGAAKPDISSADAFKRSMLAARSIAYPDPAGGGASGIYVASLLERLGIAGEMKPKTKLSPSANVLYASVASGDVEIGFNQLSEILA